MTQLFVKNLSVIDFSYFDNRRGILGESWIVDIILTGQLDEQGMVFDFGHVKKKIKHIIDTHLDHCFVISDQTKNLEVLKKNNQTELNWKHITGNYQHISPDTSLLILEAKTVNKVSISKYLEQIIFPQLPKNVDTIEIQLYEEQIEGAYYHYSHGLKKHDGNCQRIVHGHRSKIEIFENHQRNSKLEDYWSACFRNIYIGTKEDITKEFESDGKSYVTFSYTAQQGKFSLTIPKKRVYIMDSDSTVELIAEHVLQECILMQPTNHYVIKAYEGVGKGAIARSPK
tara:strand:+ start:4630 stop:5484 length:855 start_codon:yes stop_codon:yes gene_type:complete